MTDAEMITQAHLCSRNAYISIQSRQALLALAARLEQLTAPPGKRPVTHEEESKIRESDAKFGLLSAGDHSTISHRRALLALLDWERSHRTLAEQALQDALAEDGRFDAGVQAGVAKALEELRRLAAGLHVRGAVVTEQAVLDAADHLAAACGPATLPPHERTLAENRRLREAVEKILELPRGQGVGYQALLEKAHRIARETLEQSP